MATGTHPATAGKSYPMDVPVPVKPKTPKWVVPLDKWTSRKEMRSHVGEETETKTRSTAATKQKKRPGTAGEAIFALMPLFLSLFVNCQRLGWRERDALKFLC